MPAVRCGLTWWDVSRVMSVRVGHCVGMCRGYSEPQDYFPSGVSAGCRLCFCSVRYKYGFSDSCRL